MSQDPHAIPAGCPFSQAEVEGLRADDRSATFAVVGLMAGIFSIGLVLYLGVCYWIAG